VKLILQGVLLVASFLAMFGSSDRADWGGLLSSIGCTSSSETPGTPGADDSTSTEEDNRDDDAVVLGFGVSPPRETAQSVALPRLRPPPAGGSMPPPFRPPRS
jgi:hypothetical protein